MALTGSAMRKSVSMPIANDAEGCAGMRCWKKRTPSCNGADRGLDVTLPRKGADFP